MCIIVMYTHIANLQTIFQLTPENISKIVFQTVTFRNLAELFSKTSDLISTFLFEKSRPDKLKNLSEISRSI